MNKRDVVIIFERQVIMQAFIENYLLREKKKTFEELYPDEKEEYGLLSKKQEEILHDYLAFVYKEFGLDLNQVLKEKGEVLKPGENLTEFEKKELLRLADEQIFLSGVIINRKERFKKRKENKNV